MKPIKDKDTGTSEKLSKSQQKRLLGIARQTLKEYLKNKKIPALKIKDQFLNKELGVFVTLRKDGRLRGCIGEFEPKRPLFQTVQNKAIDAAFYDPRFPQLRDEELKDIEIEISILSPVKKIKDWHKIKLGKHGVIIRQGLKAGTFLPQVAIETGWDLKTFLANLCFHKAGLNLNCYQDPKTEIFIFTAQVFSEEK